MKILNIKSYFKVISVLGDSIRIRPIPSLCRKIRAIKRPCSKRETLIQEFEQVLSQHPEYLGVGLLNVNLTKLTDLDLWELVRLLGRVAPILNPLNEHNSATVRRLDETSGLDAMEFRQIVRQGQQMKKLSGESDQNYDKHREYRQKKHILMHDQDRGSSTEITKENVGTCFPKCLAVYRDTWKKSLHFRFQGKVSDLIDRLEKANYLSIQYAQIEVFRGYYDLARIVIAMKEIQSRVNGLDSGDSSTENPLGRVYFDWKKAIHNNFIQNYNNWLTYRFSNLSEDVEGKRMLLPIQEANLTHIVPATNYIESVLALYALSAIRLTFAPNQKRLLFPCLNKQCRRWLLTRDDSNLLCCDSGGCRSALDNLKKKTEESDHIFEIIHGDPMKPRRAV